jgi:hypothetical protein
MSFLDKWLGEKDKAGSADFQSAMQNMINNPTQANYNIVIDLAKAEGLDEEQITLGTSFVINNMALAENPNVNGLITVNDIGALVNASSNLANDIANGQGNYTNFVFNPTPVDASYLDSISIDNFDINNVAQQFNVNAADMNAMLNPIFLDYLQSNMPDLYEQGLLEIGDLIRSGDLDQPLETAISQVLTTEDGVKLANAALMSVAEDLNFVTSTDLKTAIATVMDSIPAVDTRTDEEINTLVSSALSNYVSADDFPDIDNLISTAISNYAASDTDADTVRSDADIQSLIDTAVSAIPADTIRSDADIQSLINTAISAIPADSTRSDAEIQTLINNSVTNYLTAADLPEDLVRSDTEIQSLIDTAITGIDTTRSDTEIQNIVNTSLAGIDFSPYLTATDLPDYQGMIDLALSTIPEDTQISETDLTKSIANYLTTNDFVTLEDLPDFEAIVDESIGGIDYSQFATTETTADFLTSAEIKQLIEDAQLSSPNVYTQGELLDRYNNSQAASDFGIFATYDPETNTFTEDVSSFGFTGDAATIERTAEEFLERLGIENGRFLNAVSQSDVQDLINTALENIPPDTQISPEDLNTAISSYLTENNFVTQEALPDFQGMIDESIGAIDFSDLATVEDLEAVTLESLGGITPDQVQELINTGRLTAEDVKDLISANPNYTDEDILAIARTSGYTDEELNDLLDARDTAITALGTDITDLETALGTDITDLETALTTNITDLGTDLTNLATTLGTDITGLQTALDSLGVDLTDLGIALGTDISDLQTGLTDLETGLGSRIDLLDSSVIDINDRIEIMQGIYDQALIDLQIQFETDLTTLRENLEGQDVLLQQALTDLTTQLQTNVEALQTEFGLAIQEAIQGLDDRFMGILENYTTTEELNSILENYVTGEELGSTLDEYVTQIQNDYEDLLDRQEDLQDQLNTADNQYEVDALSVQLDDVQAQIDDFINNTGFDPNTGTIPDGGTDGGGGVDNGGPGGGGVDNGGPGGPGGPGGGGTGGDPGGGGVDNGGPGGPGGPGGGDPGGGGVDNGGPGGPGGPGGGGGVDNGGPGGPGGPGGGGGVDNGGPGGPGGPGGGGVDNGDPGGGGGDPQPTPGGPGGGTGFLGNQLPPRNYQRGYDPYTRPEPPAPLTGLTALTQPYNRPRQGEPVNSQYNPTYNYPYPYNGPDAVDGPELEEAQQYSNTQSTRRYNYGGQIQPITDMSMNDMLQNQGIGSLTNYETNVAPFQNAFRPNVRRYN